jgi:hypothetical protein
MVQGHSEVLEEVALNISEDELKPDQGFQGG